HALFREGAYATLTENDRALGHALAGDWLEARGESDAMMLAEHFERGQLLDRALRYYPRAAQQALEANDLQGALARAEPGIACGAHGADLGELRMFQAEARNWLGDNAEGLALASEAMSLLPQDSAAWHAAAKEGLILANQVGDASRVLDIVAAIARSPTRGA